MGRFEPMERIELMERIAPQMPPNACELTQATGLGRRTTPKKNHLFPCINAKTRRGEPASGFGMNHIAVTELVEAASQTRKGASFSDLIS
jgi:hypothetical protein